MSGGARVRRRVGALLAAAAVALVAGCSTGTDAVAQGGTFDFVSPGGQTTIRYDPPESRGTIGDLGGQELLTDQPIAISDFPGQVVVLNLWGQWCAPCRAEAQGLQEVFTASQDRGVAFLGINVRDPQRDKAQDFVRDQGITYPSVYDPTLRSLLALGGDYPTSVIPSTIVLDREHRVAAVFLTELLASDLQPVVDAIAAESPAPGAAGS